ncbi:tyrosine kinase-like protein (TKL3) [Plasmodium ovale curtisi]|uniref:Tyrosine kinase-like protein (TKL3) n=1 Tax=Plasmodium ovale curtisi TaxID=864141 RepID=A0A1A8WXF6_PLAOA|nr:tyrosine kinase-like protein (TKL3) [Plasmodium ovale curtisi]
MNKPYVGASRKLFCNSDRLFYDNLRNLDERLKLNNNFEENKYEDLYSQKYVRSNRRFKTEPPKAFCQKDKKNNYASFFQKIFGNISKNITYNENSNERETEVRAEIDIHHSPQKCKNTRVITKQEESYNDGHGQIISGENVFSETDDNMCARQAEKKSRNVRTRGRKSSVEGNAINVEDSNDRSADESDYGNVQRKGIRGKATEAITRIGARVVNSDIVSDVFLKKNVKSLIVEDTGGVDIELIENENPEFLYHTYTGNRISNVYYDYDDSFRNRDYCNDKKISRFSSSFSRKEKDNTGNAYNHEGLCYHKNGSIKIEEEKKIIKKMKETKRGICTYKSEASTESNHTRIGDEHNCVKNKEMIEEKVVNSSSEVVYRELYKRTSESGNDNEGSENINLRKVRHPRDGENEKNLSSERNKIFDAFSSVSSSSMNITEREKNKKYYYIGETVNNVRNGWGMLIYNDRVIFEGEYKMNNAIGYFIKYNEYSTEIGFRSPISIKSVLIMSDNDNFIIQNKCENLDTCRNSQSVSRNNNSCSVDSDNLISAYRCNNAIYNKTEKGGENFCSSEELENASNSSAFSDFKPTPPILSTYNKSLKGSLIMNKLNVAKGESHVLAHASSSASVSPSASQQASSCASVSSATVSGGREKHLSVISSYVRRNSKHKTTPARTINYLKPPVISGIRNDLFFNRNSFSKNDRACTSRRKREHKTTHFLSPMNIIVTSFDTDDETSLSEKEEDESNELGKELDTEDSLNTLRSLNEEDCTHLGKDTHQGKLTDLPDETSESKDSCANHIEREIYHGENERGGTYYENVEEKQNKLNVVITNEYKNLICENINNDNFVIKNNEITTFEEFMERQDSYKEGDSKWREAIGEVRAGMRGFSHINELSSGTNLDDCVDLVSGTNLDDCVDLVSGTNLDGCVDLVGGIGFVSGTELMSGTELALSTDAIEEEEEEEEEVVGDSLVENRENGGDESEEGDGEGESGRNGNGVKDPTTGDPLCNMNVVRIPQNDHNTNKKEEFHFYNLGKTMIRRRLRGATFPETHDDKQKNCFLFIDDYLTSNDNKFDVINEDVKLRASDYNKWSVNMLYNFLKMIGLKKEAYLFKIHKIRGYHILKLTDKELKRLNINNCYVRKYVLSVFRFLVNSIDNADPLSLNFNTRHNFSFNKIRNICNSDITILNKIGGGSYAQVFKAKYKGSHVACKLFLYNPKDLSDESYCESYISTPRSSHKYIFPKISKNFNFNGSLMEGENNSISEDPSPSRDAFPLVEEEKEMENKLYTLQRNKKIKKMANLEIFRYFPTPVKYRNYEAKILYSLKGCNNVIKMIGVCSLREGEESLILQYCSGGSLEKYIYQDEKKKNAAYKMYLSRPKIVRIFQQVAQGMYSIHSKNFLHRDIKLSNILLDENQNAVISDFGLSTYFSPNDSPTAYAIYGNIFYAAPEVLKGEGFFKESDVWSFAVSLWEALTKKIAYDGLSASETFCKISSGELVLPIPKDIPVELSDLLKSMLEYDFTRRPLFDVIAKKLEYIRRSADKKLHFDIISFLDG